MDGRLLIGVGSPHGDDQVGWWLVDRLQQLSDESDRPVPFELLALSDPIDLLNHLAGVELLVVIDACEATDSPGSITRWEWGDSTSDEDRSHSTHRFSVIQALELASVLGRLPVRTVIYGVEIEACRPATDLSPSVLASFPDLVQRVLSE